MGPFSISIAESVKMNVNKKTSTDNLIKFAAEHLGQDLSHLKDDRPKLIEELEQLKPGLFNGGNTNQSKPGSEDKKPKADAKASHYTIIVEDDGDETMNYIQVGFNGRMYQIVKGEEAKVPCGIVDVLNNAIEINYKQKEVNGQKVTIETKKKRWPFQTVDTHFDIEDPDKHFGIEGEKGTR